MLHITSDHNIIAFILLPLSFALNKLLEFVSKKVLVWKGENPDKMTAVDKVYLPIAIFFIFLVFDSSYEHQLSGILGLDV